MTGQTAEIRLAARSAGGVLTHWWLQSIDGWERVCDGVGQLEWVEQAPTADGPQRVCSHCVDLILKGQTAAQAWIESTSPNG